MAGATPLHYAAELGHLECVRALLDAGSSVGAVIAPPSSRWLASNQGCNPLHLAAEAGHLAVVLVMLKHFVSGTGPLLSAVDCSWVV